MSRMINLFKKNKLFISLSFFMFALWWVGRLLLPGASHALLNSSRGAGIIFIAKCGGYIIMGLLIFEIMSGRYKIMQKKDLNDDKADKGDI